MPKVLGYVGQALEHRISTLWTVLELRCGRIHWYGTSTVRGEDQLESPDSQRLPALEWVSMVAVSRRKVVDDIGVLAPRRRRETGFEFQSSV